ncbi:MAG: VWA domain-containing protein [Microcoleus sp. PH2017_25_DOB_D_A]|uniref:vWA domain-containing protein n=1 Tax=unclassified Microcoleus TaxID=2642155 RepID=UPI001D967830|nr:MULTISPECIES: VWA domain-containing protein [unclassified Microcoleus]TAE15263.1 MAG: VWA domain-containing protein [Oscillatoriales cyanobacterium]MCC3447247.1 VWA domain-containing protein [Microcoleus sp. PH2017_09_SFU_O_A]MCC3533375.1 VWA domain-containing protein [Microcoleus sp. PH2017_25_DOB_D_A]MCC3545699.1 VWA domain-containing protein [Microcoleus sp. PH2017_24_DOB_U_A]MCC3566159.1 VWA domain-containing protein [Microcoleus sp. PH2017_31_RDM_U_A]
MSTQFQAEVFQNPYLHQGSREVNAIMTVTVRGDENIGIAPQTGGKLFGIICDISGSMQGAKIHAAKNAMIKLVQLIPADTSFFIVVGSTRAQVIFPTALATVENKSQAISQIKEVQASGGTLMSQWLEASLTQFKEMPNAVRQALLLTDGQNDDSDQKRLEKVLQACEGVFQCDCRGVGTDWRVKQLQFIANRLLGTTDIIANAVQIEADFQTILAQAMTKTVSDVALRLWTPQGAKVRFCKQVSPEIVDLTDRAQSIKPQVCDYPTGAWGTAESRDYHFCIEVNPGNVGDEMLAGRASLIYTADGVETKITEARILAVWTDDEQKSTKIDRRVAHYTGQAELAQTIQEGLEARDKGDVEVATAKLGRAVKLAHDSGNEGTAKLLRQVVEVEDAPTGTVRLKRNVAKEDEMALETRSTKTARISRN